MLSLQELPVLEMFNPYPAGQKVVSLRHQYRVRPDYISVQFDQALYCWLTIFKFILTSLRMKMDCSKKKLEGGLVHLCNSAG